MRWNVLGVLLSLSAAGAVGCGTTEDPTLGGGVGEGGATGLAADGGGPATTTGPDTTTSGDAGDTMEPDDECGAIAVTADVERAPADIVIALDTSGSMDEEFCAVGMNLAAFADGVGPNTRVTTVYDTSDDFLDGLAAALGFGGIGGGCGGEDPFANTTLAADPERYRHVTQMVGSHNALERLLSTYGSYANFLREGSPTHFVVVTDDTSNMPGDQFRTQMEANLGGSFYFHAIAYTGNDMGNDNCSGDTGQQYLDLATATGGEQLSICATDWSQLFAELEAAVEATSPIPCAFPVPEPPPGQAFSPNEVSVSYTAPGGVEQVFPRAKNADACGDQAGWHFDDETTPTEIEFCPAACERVGDGGELGIAFGCEPPILL